ncbi:MAG: DUF547 domain-containing protein [Acidobacteria bacterium]|nr:DUF547 domain-containing protein [Acidobacteriota bacterium]
MTLDGIEHEVLRKQFREPRIHVALVCAAMGYPPLRNEPFEGAKLEEQLADQTRRFLANPRKFRIDRSQRRVYLSAIFDWYGEDFVPLFGTEERFGGHGAAERAVLHFISRHLGEADRAYLERETYALEYLDYDWSLNEQAPAGEGS